MLISQEHQLMKRLLFAAMVLCMGVMVSSCSKDNNNTGNWETNDASPLVGIWAILDEAGQKAAPASI